MPDLAEDQLVGHEHVGQHHLVEVVGAVEERDGADLHAVAVQVDEQLARPWCLLPSSIGEVRHSTTNQSFSWAPLVQIFVPLAASRRRPGWPWWTPRPGRCPLSGSLIPIENATSPRQMAGRNRWRCSSVPNRRITDPVWRSATQWCPTGAPQRSSSSTTMKRSTAVRSWPPYLLRQRHADPAPLGQPLGELGVAAGPHAEAGLVAALRQLLPEEVPHLGLEPELLCRQLGRGESQAHRSCL